MLDDLDKSLQELFRRELPKSLTDQVSITFDVPNDQFPPPSVTLPAIDLFLYDVQENRDLRSMEQNLERRIEGRGTQRRAPVRVDCSYLVTAWPSDSSPNPSQDEHRMLGEVMRVLLRYSTVPAEFLQGELRAQELPLPTVALQPGRLSAIGEFWQACGGKPKTALNYTATIAVNIYPPAEVPLVTSRTENIERTDRFARADGLARTGQFTVLKDD
jgi:hypothetical protein